jgi:hypothetical protein
LAPLRSKRETHSVALKNSSLKFREDTHDFSRPLLEIKDCKSYFTLSISIIFVVSVQRETGNTKSPLRERFNKRCYASQAAI